MALTLDSPFPLYTQFAYIYILPSKLHGIAIKVGEHSSFCHIHSSEICRSRAPLYGFHTLFVDLFLTTVTTICFLKQKKKEHCKVIEGVRLYWRSSIYFLRSHTPRGESTYPKKKRFSSCIFYGSLLLVVKVMPGKIVISISESAHFNICAI